MAHVTVAFHGDLNDFLPEAMRNTPLRRQADGRPAVKDVLEAAGVPHPEIMLIRVNEQTVGLESRVHDGDRVEAWPAGMVGPDGRRIPQADPPGGGTVTGFVADGHLGRLAAYLRMLGFDTWYRIDADDALLADVAAAEERILLTRDRLLLRRSIVRRGAWIRSDRPVEQLIEVCRRFQLADRWQPFGRCLRCNASLAPVSREEILHRLEPLTQVHYDDFRRCPSCDSIYWKGSHHDRMERLIERVRAAVAVDSCLLR
jgi:uncharacterized protein